jgi:hypothetical protein
MPITPDSFDKLFLKNENIVPWSSAIAFDGTGDYLTLANSTDFNFGTNPLTMEGWFMFNSIPSVFELWNFGDYTTSVNRCQLNNGTLYATLVGSHVTYAWTPVVNRWYHIAASREGTGTNQWRLFINGVNVASATNSANVQTASSLNVIGAEQTGSQCLNGFVKEFRVSNVARYTTAFTPATSFTVDANTKLYIKGDAPISSPYFGGGAVGGAIGYYAISARGVGNVFTAHASYPLQGFTLELNKTGSPAYNLTPRLYLASNGIPTGSALASATALDVSTLTGSYVLKTFTFSSAYTLTAGNSYVLMLERDSGSHDTSNYVSALFLNSTERSATKDASDVYIGYSSGRYNYTLIGSINDSETTPKTVTVVGDTRIKGCGSNYGLFLDSSTASPKTVTANGSAVQFPCKINRTAGFFNGTTDYVVVPDSADWDFGTGDYSLEFFVNFSQMGTTQALVVRSVGTTYSWGVMSGASNEIYIMENDVARVTSATQAVKQNTWHHISAIRTSGTTRLYIDGLEVGTAYVGSQSVSSAELIYIGRGGSTRYFGGWIKEVRISNVARTVAVPTSEYSPDSNTKLLMHFDTPATSPLGPAIYFDGTGDYLKTLTSQDFAHGTGNFTYEAWAYYQIGSGDHPIISVGQNSGGYPAGPEIRQYGTSIYTYLGATNRHTYDISSLMSVGRWYHVALVRNGNDLTLFLNGKLLQTLNVTGVTVPTLTDGVYIGSNANLTGYFLGSLKEIRASNVARYTSPFTPSQTGFTVDANTLLYIKGNENNGSPLSSVPLMTSNTAPSGVASSSATGGDPANAFVAFKGTRYDGSTDGEYYVSHPGDGNLYNRYQFTSAKIITRYELQAISDYRYTPTGHILQGSNDGTNWTSIDTVSGLTWTNYEFKIFNCTNTTAYLYYQIRYGTFSPPAGFAGYKRIFFYESANYVKDSETTPKIVTPNAGASAPTIKYTEDYRSCIFKNDGTKVVDGGLEVWTSATQLTNWVYGQTGSGGSVNRESSIIHGGTYSARIVKSSTGNSVIYQTVYGDFAGKAYSFSVYAKSANSAASAVQIAINFYDASSVYISTSPLGLYQNTNTWELLTSSGTAPDGAARADISINVISTATADAYFDDVLFTSDAGGLRSPYSVGSAKVDFFSAFGSGVAYFDNATDNSSLICPTNADWNLGGLAGGDFTLEMYVRWKGLVTNAYYGLIGADNNAGAGFKFYYQYPYYLALYDGSTIKSWPNYPTNTFIPLVNVWYHIVFMRIGSLLYCFVNGNKMGPTNSDSDFNNDSQPMGVGTYKASAPQAAFNGVMDNVRWAKGIARYTSTDFNPPEDNPLVGYGQRGFLFLL